jgi:hypothetical protein
MLASRLKRPLVTIAAAAGLLAATVPATASAAPVAPQSGKPATAHPIVDYWRSAPMVAYSWRP